ncbi:hypothetical protein BS50DRAFT_679972 [Corynespora cassiicola Philippines]|uniref:Uncharacterized protein n=1 Tax=Corynespora cassiicola Philippines TaxID=1448308 RepID=A0A2T2NB57_CORCC|nr:hypothetical protein BS50DRAFT_679972 [Corynespora cassiicola Philippines]
MKVLQLAVLLGGAVSPALASINDARAENALNVLSTSVVYQTSLYTVTHCGTIDCTVSGTTVVTSVVALTTTVCPALDTPVTTPINEEPTTALSAELPFVTTSDFIGTIPSMLPGTSWSSYSIPLDPHNSYSFPSFGVTTSTDLDSLPTASEEPSYGGSSSTDTDAVPTSFATSSPGYGHTPPVFTSIKPIPSLHTSWPNFTTHATTQVTSVLSHTATSVITKPHPSNSTEVDPVPTASHGTSISGSGHLPSTTGNHSITSLLPTYTEFPSLGQRIGGAGKSSIAAIVVAFAFTLFA